MIRLVWLVVLAASVVLGIEQERQLIVARDQTEHEHERAEQLQLLVWSSKYRPGDVVWVRISGEPGLRACVLYDAGDGKWALLLPRDDDEAGPTFFMSFTEEELRSNVVAHRRCYGYASGKVR